MTQLESGKVRAFLAVLVLGGAAAIAGMAVADLSTLPPTPRLIEQRVGFLLLALKVSLCEAGVKGMLAQVPFMRRGFARGLFLIFCGSLTLDVVFSPALVFGAVAMGLGLLATLLGLLVELKHLRKDPISSNHPQVSI